MTSRKRKSDTTIMTSPTPTTTASSKSSMVDPLSHPSHLGNNNRTDLGTSLSVFSPHSNNNNHNSNNSNKTHHRRPKIKVTIKRFHGVAKWTWNAGDGDEVCGICQSAFEGVAPGVKYPGDECPVVWGKCGHSFHLQCVSTWLSSSRSTCPICRREWEFGAEKEVGEGKDDDANDDNE